MSESGQTTIIDLGNNTGNYKFTNSPDTEVIMGSGNKSVTLSGDHDMVTMGAGQQSVTLSALSNTVMFHDTSFSGHNDDANIYQVNTVDGKSTVLDLTGTTSDWTLVDQSGQVVSSHEAGQSGTIAVNMEGGEIHVSGQDGDGGVIKFTGVAEILY